MTKIYYVLLLKSCKKKEAIGWNHGFTMEDVDFTLDV